MSDKDKAEELLQQSKEQKRHQTEPSTTDTEAATSLDDAIHDAYRQLHDGEMHENLTVRDDDLAALFQGLAETNALTAVGDRANERLGRSGATDSKAAVAKVVLRVGLEEVAADEVEAAKAGKREFLSSQADEF